MLLFSITFLCLTLTSVTSGYIFPCYYYYEPLGLTPEVLPSNLCTHIVFIGCVDDSSGIALPVSKTYNCSNAFEKVERLRRANPNLVLLMSMGGHPKTMEKIVRSEELMDKYFDSAIDLVKKFKYDGIDFDWEFPSQAAKPYFTKFLAALRDRVGSSMLLTAAIGTPLKYLKRCYELDGLGKYLDYVFIMCYNYNTIYNNYTAYTSPLYARPEETGYDATLNINFTVHYLLDHQVPREKIVVGLSADGHTFQLQDKKIFGFHANVTGIGAGSGWTTLSQMCRTANGGGVTHYDSIAEMTYVTYDDQWINCGDVRGAIAKTKWVKDNNLGGVFTWALNIDDLTNDCGYNISYPLHSSIRKVLFDTDIDDWM